jgi:hypothetical protein
MLNCMDVGIIPGKAIFVPIHHLLNMSRCDFCKLNDHATKLTYRVLKMSRYDFCGMIILPAKITSAQVESVHLNDLKAVGVIGVICVISVIGVYHKYSRID